MSRKKLTKYDIKIHNRIKETRIYYNYTLTAFAKSLGFSQSYMSEVENGKTKPSLVLLYQISENTSINLHWLFTGEGKMLREKNTNEAYLETSLDNDPEVAELLKGAKKVLKSGNKAAFDALQRNIRYFAHTIKVEERLVKIEQNMKHRMVAMEKQITELKENQNPAFSQNI